MPMRTLREKRQRLRPPGAAPASAGSARKTNMHQKDHHQEQDLRVQHGAADLSLRAVFLSHNGAASRMPSLLPSWPPISAARIIWTRRLRKPPGRCHGIADRSFPSVMHSSEFSTRHGRTLRSVSSCCHDLECLSGTGSPELHQDRKLPEKLRQPFRSKLPFHFCIT